MCRLRHLEGIYIWVVQVPKCMYCATPYDGSVQVQQLDLVVYLKGQLVTLVLYRVCKFYQRRRRSGMHHTLREIVE